MRLLLLLIMMMMMMMMIITTVMFAQETEHELPKIVREDKLEIQLEYVKYERDQAKFNTLLEPFVLVDPVARALRVSMNTTAGLVNALILKALQDAGFDNITHTVDPVAGIFIKRPDAP
jgi:biopolymer transport protein ExbD